MIAERSALRRSGFTLLELLIVIAFIGVTAGLAAPGLSSAMAIRRADRATHQLVRIGRRARTESASLGRAHMIRYSNFSSGSAAMGQVSLWRGLQSACAANDWAAIIRGTCATTPECLDQLDMGEYNLGTHRVEMRLPGSGTGDLCYQPDGELLFRNGGAAGTWGTTAPSGAGAVLFLFRRQVSGSYEGVQLRVAFPFGGAPPRVQ